MSDSAKVPQFFCRQPKSVSLFQAEPLFRDLPNFVPPNGNEQTRCAQYVSNGNAFLYTLPNSIQLVDTITGLNLFEIKIPDVFELDISPNGNYITTWSKLIKDPENDNNYLKNVNIIYIDLINKNYKIIHSFLNKSKTNWIPQFTADESIICFYKNPYSLNFFKISPNIEIDLSKPFNSLDLKNFGKIEDFKLSQGKNPSIAIFIPANNGNPAFIKVFSLLNLKSTVSEKQFFKGESCIFKWNSLGTSLLALVTTDVDASNKSYYGESQLYLLDISGLFVQKINLPHEGPIHECTWSPTSREFAVIYGFMPATTTFFDSRGNSIHSLPKNSRNTILYSPHAKYILVAGFGNLPGDIDILDRQNKFNVIKSFKASNTSVCKWSPDGRFILTATTSPRLRVDNSVKIWYFNGSLVYYKSFEELFNIDWRNQPLNDFPPITVSKADKLDCEPHQSAIDYLSKFKKNDSVKKTGAYRPPHARLSGSSNIVSGRSLADLHEQKQNGYSNKSTMSSIPGYAPKIPTNNVIPGYSPVESKSAIKNRRKRANKKEAGEGGETTASTPTSTSTSPQPQSQLQSQSNNASDLVIGGVVSLEEKKIRNLLKKLRAIEILKQKDANFEHLEDTQKLKIQTEGAVREELKSLGWNGVL